MSKLARIGGRYRLQARIGKSDQAILWAAVDERSGLPVAVRIQNRGLEDARRVARFGQSARASARIEHPHVLPVLDEGLDEAGPYTVSAWTEATPLSAWIKQDAPWGFLKAVLVQVADALAHVHAEGLVHLELRPSNILVRPRAALGSGSPAPEVFLQDVGGGRLDDAWGDSSLGAQATLKYLGSLRYLAPEVAESPPWKAGPWSDLYSLGLVLWELLAGSIPFETLSGVALLLERAVAPVPELPPAVGGALRGPLEALLARLLARDPLDRPTSAAQVRQTLLSLPGEPVWSPPPPQPVVALPPGDARRERAAGFPLRALRGRRPVGREAVSRLLAETLHRVVVGGTGRLVVIEGPPASGKGRLVEALARHAATQGSARAWTVRYHPGQPPGSGLAGALEDLLKANTTDRTGLAARLEALPLLLGFDGSDLDGLLTLLHPDAPGFSRPGAFATPAATLGGRPASAATTAFFLECVRRTAHNDALLIWLDDIQHAPEGELATLVSALLAERLPVCVVATGRSGTDGLRRLQAGWPPGAQVDHVVLGPVDPQEIRVLLRERLALAPMVEQQVLAVVHERPSLLEGLTGWLQDGRLMPGADGNHLLPGTILPESGPELWRHLLASLPSQGPDTLVPDVVAGLALSRLPLTARVLEALGVGDPELPVGRALAAAERARLIVASPTGTFRFPLEVAAWLAQGFAERAARWHTLWLRTLERLEGRAYGRFGWERAWHAEALGRTDDALEALLDAATWALSPGEAAYERGLRAATRARALAETVRDPLRSGRAERIRAEILRELGQAGEARDVLAALEPRLMIPPARRERAHCLLVRGLLDLDADRLDAATQACEEADALFAAEGDEAGRLWVQVALGHVACRRGHHRLARTGGRDAEEAFRTLGDTRGRLAARLLRATAAEAAADHETAEQRLASVAEVTEQRGWLLDGIHLRLRRAVVALHQARPHDALALLDEALRRAEPHGLVGLADWMGAVRPAVLAAAGEPAAARSARERARLPSVQVEQAAAAVSAALRLPTTHLDPSLATWLEAWHNRLAEAAIEDTHRVEV